MTPKRADLEQEALRHIDLLFNIAVQITGNHTDAEALVSKTYVKALKFLHKLEKRTNCKVWLFRLMKNIFINNFHKKPIMPTPVSAGKLPPDHKHRQEIDISDLNQEHLLDELSEDDVKKALDALPFEYKFVVVLSDIAGFTYQEIAYIVECQVKTVRSRLSRARKMLQECLYDVVISKNKDS